jgi:hypothetical protein
LGDLVIKGRIISVGAPKAHLKAFRPAVKQALQDTLEMWWRRLLPKHFRAGAVGRYGYDKRTRKYQIRKAQKKGHQQPLVFTGDLKRMVTRRAAFSGSRTRATVTLQGPWYAQMIRKNTRGPDIAGEVTTVTPAEQRVMDQLVDRNVTRALNQSTEREVIST